MIAVGMMKVPVHKVVDMIAVGYRGMPAARAVNMVLVVALAVVGGASVRIGLRDLDGVLIVVVAMGTMKVPVVQIPHVVSMLYSQVAAVRAVLVVVVFMDFVGHVSGLPTRELSHLTYQTERSKSVRRNRNLHTKR